MSMKTYSLHQFPPPRCRMLEHGGVHQRWAPMQAPLDTHCPVQHPPHGEQPQGWTAWSRQSSKGDWPAQTCVCGLDLAACGACGRGGSPDPSTSTWASRALVDGPGAQPWSHELNGQVPSGSLVVPHPRSNADRGGASSSIADSIPAAQDDGHLPNMPVSMDHDPVDCTPRPGHPSSAVAARVESSSAQWPAASSAQWPAANPTSSGYPDVPVLAVQELPSGSVLDSRRWQIQARSCENKLKEVNNSNCLYYSTEGALRSPINTMKTIPSQSQPG